MGLATILTGRSSLRQGFVDPDSSSGKVGTVDSSGRTLIERGEVALVLDAIIEESPEINMTPTVNLVEDGSDITDHIVRQPDKLTIRSQVSDASLTFFRTTDQDFLDSPSKDAWNFIKTRLADTKEPFDFVTAFDVYKNYALTSLVVTKTAATGNVLAFRATMQKIRVVESVVVEVPVENVSEDVAPTASTRENKGTQGTQSTTEANEDKASSILLKMGELVGAF